jgi:hypothetical protein
MTNEEVLARAMEIQRAKNKTRQDERLAAYQAEQRRLEREDRAFAESIGITYEQYEHVESRVRQRIDDER